MSLEKNFNFESLLFRLDLPKRTSEERTAISRRITDLKGVKIKSK